MFADSEKLDCDAELSARVHDRIHVVSSAVECRTLQNEQVCQGVKERFKGASNEVMAAPSLADRKIVRSVRKPVLKVKAALCSPYNVVWPQVAKETVEQILDDITKLFTAVDLKKPSVPKNTSKDKKKETMMERWNEKTEEERNLRSQLTIGLGSTTRSLECDRLRLVMVDRSTPSLLHRHLIQLAAVRQCPAVAVNGLSQMLAPLLGMQSQVAVGFKKLSDTDSRHFDPLVCRITRDAPTISLPWADFEAAVLQPEEESDHDDSAPMEGDHLGSPMESGHLGSPTESGHLGSPMESSHLGHTNTQSDSIPDYSHLYIYKLDIKVSEAEDSFIALDSDDSDGTTNRTKSSRKRTQVKQGHGKKAKITKSAQHKKHAREYVGANVVQIFANVNKQKKGKRKK